MLNYFHKDLIFLDCDIKNTDELFHEITSKESVKPFIEDSFCEAIIKREQDFPTGLDFFTHTIAIPHADPIHVKQEAIIFIRPKENILFKDMGLGDEELQVKLILMLLLKKGRVELLEKTMAVFSDESVSQALMSAQTANEVYQILIEKYK